VALQALTPLSRQPSAAQSQDHSHGPLAGHGGRKSFLSVARIAAVPYPQTLLSLQTAAMARLRLNSGTAFSGMELEPHFSIASLTISRSFFVRRAITTSKFPPLAERLIELGRRIT
jgi:hypothetical protein